MSHAVSIVVTCFNYGEYIEGALTSVYNQSFEDYEVIVVDDGSTDNSEEQVRPFLDDNRFRYIKQKNAGQANAKNRGIKESTGEFIAFLDADDLWKKDKLEQQLKLFENLEVGVVYSKASLIDAQGEPLPMPSQGKYLHPRRGMISNYLFLDNFIWFSSAVVRRECLNKLGLFDESLQMSIDWDLWLRISTRYAFDFVDEPLLAYRVGHSGQMSQNMVTRQQCSDRIMESFLKNFPEVVDQKFVKEAYYSTFCTRGRYYRELDRKVSYQYFLKAIALKPWRVSAYNGLLKSILISLGVSPR